MVDSVFGRRVRPRGDITRAPKVGVARATSTTEVVSCSPTSTLCSPHFVRVDDFLPKRHEPGRPPRITDAELIALAVAQMFLAIPDDRKFLALARWRLGHLFPYLPKQPGYNKRLRSLAPTIARVITHLAVNSPSFCDNLRLLDSTPVPCGQSRETARRARSCRPRRLRLVQEPQPLLLGLPALPAVAPDGMPICFELAPANATERVVAAERLAREGVEVTKSVSKEMANNLGRLKLFPETRERFLVNGEKPYEPGSILV